MTSEQPSPFKDTKITDRVVEAVLELVDNLDQPSAWDLVKHVETEIDIRARWLVTDALRRISKDRELVGMTRDYAVSILESDDLVEALQGKQSPGKEIESSIDLLLQQSAVYRSSETFQEMIGFMGNFRDYAPFNNMLVKVQNPSCSFYATARHWEQRFERRLIDDARPMLILAPMHPVMLVYDLDQTEGPALPKELQNFATFQGDFDVKHLHRLVENALKRDKIRVEFKRLSSTNAGFATISTGCDGSKMRIAIHDDLDDPSRFGVLCHELAHIYLGHLGNDPDRWWPARGNLSRYTMEVEAEATAYIVTRRSGLSGSSSAYVSGYLKDDSVLKSVSLDVIAKVAGRLDEMATRNMPPRRAKQRTIRGSTE